MEEAKKVLGFVLLNRLRKSANYSIEDLRLCLDENKTANKKRHVIGKL